MKIGLFSLPGDEQAQLLRAALERRRPGSVRAFDLSLPRGARATLDAQRLTWDGCDLTGLDLAILRGFSYQDPVIPSGNLDRDWSMWRDEYLAEQQTYSFLQSLFCELSRRGVQVVNPVAAHLKAWMKPALLEELRRAGLLVPDFICTNEMSAALDFCRARRRVVWRPATGRAAWQLCLDRQREALVSLQKPPVLLAEAVPGPCLRGYVFRGELLLALACAAPNLRPEERLECFWDARCAALEKDLARVAELVGAPWLQVVFVLRRGQAWLYDVDPDRLYVDLPPEQAEDLNQKLAARLLGVRAAAKPRRGPPVVLPRRSLFLRRMLDILFEFEASKYPKSARKRKSAQAPPPALSAPASAPSSAAPPAAAPSPAAQPVAVPVPIAPRP